MRSGRQKAGLQKIGCNGHGGLLGNSGLIPPPPPFPSTPEMEGAQQSSSKTKNEVTIFGGRLSQWRGGRFGFHLEFSVMEIECGAGRNQPQTLSEAESGSHFFFLSLGAVGVLYRSKQSILCCLASHRLTSRPSAYEGVDASLC